MKINNLKLFLIVAFKDIHFVTNLVSKSFIALIVLLVYAVNFVLVCLQAYKNVNLKNGKYFTSFMSVILICVNILVLRYNLCLQLFRGGIPLNRFDIQPKPLEETHKLTY
jgi:hypothetical protein